MADLARPERVRDDADDFAARGEDGVGELAHQADAAAAVHELDRFGGERLAHALRGGGERGIVAGVRAAEHTDAPDRRQCSPAASHFPIVSAISFATLSFTLRKYSSAFF